MLGEFGSNSMFFVSSEPMFFVSLRATLCCTSLIMFLVKVSMADSVSRQHSSSGLPHWAVRTGLTQKVFRDAFEHATGQPVDGWPLGSGALSLAT